MKNKLVFFNLFYYASIFLLLFFLYCQNPVAIQSPLYPNFIDESTNSALTEYFENDTLIPDGVKSFVFFQYYKIAHDSANHYRVMLRLYSHCITVRYQQVFDYNLGFRSPLYVVHIRKGITNCIIEQVDALPLFAFGSDTLKKMFPEDLHDRIHSKENDCYYEINMQHNRDRIIDYCKNMLPADRFIYVEPPLATVDFHHDQNIYSYLNLKAGFEYVTITEELDTIRNVPPIQMFTMAESPDGRFRLFYIFGRSDTANFEYFYKDNQTGKLFQIKNVMDDMLRDNAWRGNTILMFDQVNGHDYFDNKPYGIHFEIDLEKGKLIRALPFGYLSFPQSIAK